MVADGEMVPHDAPPDVGGPDGAGPADNARGLDALRASAADDGSGDHLERCWSWLRGQVAAHPAAGLVVAAVLSAVLAVAGVGAWVASRSGPGAPGASSSWTPEPSAQTTPGDTMASGTIGGEGSRSSDGTDPATGDLVVEVAGAVVHPGVYHLPAGSRVADLVARAGGLTPDADGDRLNQAAALVDGSMLYVPHVGQTDLPTPADGDSAGGPGGADPGGAGDATAGAPVDLNTATAAQLDALPGVGPAIASAIVTYRRQHGPFHSVDDLAAVSGIGPAKLAQIRPHARV